MSQLMWNMVLSELRDTVGAANVVVDQADRAIYGVDYFWLPEMIVDRGGLPPVPDVVVHPADAEEVSRIVRIANTYGLPVVPWGGGTGSQGGIMPVLGGITMDLKRLNRIVSIDEVSLVATVQAGINGYDLEVQLNGMGLSFPHYPASAAGATLGGYIAARGSGVLSTKYGKIEDLLMSLEVVLPNGDIIHTPPVRSHSSGPGIMDLFVGSEGTLGIVTQATIILEPLPEERRFRAFLFADTSSALEAGRKLMIERVCPTVLRVYDEASSRTRLKRILDMEVEGAFMVIGFDGWSSVIDALEERALTICNDSGARDLGPEPGEHWWQHRYDFYFPPKGLALPILYGTTDTVCTFDNIHRLYAAKKAAIEHGFAVENASYIAHFSHWYKWGVMIYDRFIVEHPPADPDEALDLHNRIWNAAVRASLASGGVINEHHGVGLKLGRLMREQYGPAYQVLQAIKDGLDSRGIMNPGKLGFRLPR